MDTYLKCPDLKTSIWQPVPLQQVLRTARRWSPASPAHSADTLGRLSGPTRIRPANGYAAKVADTSDANGATDSTTARPPVCRVLPLCCDSACRPLAGRRTLFFLLLRIRWWRIRWRGLRLVAPERHNSRTDHARCRALPIPTLLRDSVPALLQAEGGWGYRRATALADGAARSSASGCRPRQCRTSTRTAAPTCRRVLESHSPDGCRAAVFDTIRT